MKKFSKFVALCLLCGSAFAQAPKPKDGYVPNEETAVKIAEAVLSPIYGKETIYKERPFHATLNNGIWTVEGTLPAGMDGGTAQIQINKDTGAIVSYIHFK